MHIGEVQCLHEHIANHSLSMKMRIVADPLSLVYAFDSRVMNKKCWYLTHCLWYKRSIYVYWTTAIPWNISVRWLSSHHWCAACSPSWLAPQCKQTLSSRVQRIKMEWLCLMPWLRRPTVIRCGRWRMRWILVWSMPQVQDRSLDPACFHWCDCSLK